MGIFRGSSSIDKAPVLFTWGKTGNLYYYAPPQIVFPTIKKRYGGSTSKDSDIIVIYEHLIGNGYPGASNSGLWNLFVSQSYDPNSVYTWAASQASLWVSYIKTQGVNKDSTSLVILDEEKNDLLFTAKPGNTIPSGFLSFGANYFDTQARLDANYTKNIPATEPGRTLQIANDYQGCMSGILTAFLNEIHTQLPNIGFGRYGNIPSVAWRDYVIPAATSLIRDAAWYYNHPKVTHNIASTYWSYVWISSGSDNPFAPAWTLNDTHYRIYYGAAISGAKTVSNAFNKRTLCFQKSRADVHPSSLQPQVGALFMDLYKYYEIDDIVFWMAPDLSPTGYDFERNQINLWKTHIESIISTTGVYNGGGGGGGV